MNKSFLITGVKNIRNIDKPIIVLEVEGRQLGIARRPKQLLLDVDNSHLPVSDNLKVSDPEFKTVLRNLIGGTVTGDIKFFKAGDDYVIGEGHPALTDSTHELFGKVKEGDTQKAKSDGCWVEGFLSLQYNQQATMIDALATKSAQAFASMFGGAFGQPQTTTLDVVEDSGIADDLPETEEEDAMAEATGTDKPKAKSKAKAKAKAKK